MIPSEMLAMAQLWRPIRFVAIVVACAFLGGFGLALGGIAAIKLLGHLLATWGCL